MFYIKSFSVQKDNKVVKVSMCVLTDGEAYTPSFHNEVQRQWEDEPYMGRAAIWSGTFLVTVNLVRHIVLRILLLDLLKFYLTILKIHFQL